MYLNLRQIKERTTQVMRRRPFDLGRALALTKFLEELEARHGDSFAVTAVSPEMALPLEGRKDAKPVFTAGMWANFRIGSTEYHLEMSENPFFRATIFRSWRRPKKSTQAAYIANTHDITVSEYADIEMNGVMYAGAKWDAEPGTVRLLTNNLHNALKKADGRKARTYSRETPLHDSKGEQRVYGLSSPAVKQLS